MSKAGGQATSLGFILADAAVEKCVDSQACTSTSPHLAGACSGIEAPYTDFN